MTRLALALALWLVALTAQADAVEQLRRFVQGTHSGRATFEQTVTAPDGARRKDSSGSFEFVRPDRFRFDYLKPYPQQIVCDGQRVWMYDPDLNQVSVRRVDQALGATPAALLAGESLERDFVLSDLPARDGLEWVRATPRAADSGFQWMAVGFGGEGLTAVEILDRFGQRTLLKLGRLEPGVALPPERFRFTPPAGADVVQQ
ncbi:MAG: outer membrane lipoprotein chaperone LolA [Rubrivivax sp.]|nr:outer membrane lipoprotein chaperone LolA [Rubrivivax sp.]